MKKVITLMMLLGVLVNHTSAQTQSGKKVNISNSKSCKKMTNSKENANKAFLALFKDHSEEGVKSTSVQTSNPFVPTGREALIGFLPGLKQSGIAYTNHRILQDGEFVVLHNSFTNAQAFGSEKIVTIDIYRMKDGQATEHWDAIQPIAEKTASGRTQTDGPTTIEDLDKTEANKALVTSFINDVPMGKIQIK